MPYLHRFCSIRTLTEVLLLAACVTFFGCGTQSSSSKTSASSADQLRTAEVEKLIHILRNDPDVQDEFLNSRSPVIDRWRRIPLALWESLLGKPNAKNVVDRQRHWIYRTADGQVSVTIGHLQAQGELGYDAQSTPVEFLQVETVDFPVSVDPNRTLDESALKERVLAAKRSYDAATVSVKQVATQERLEKAQREERNKLAAAVDRERIETERLRLELEAAKNLAAERDAAEAKVATEQKTRQELESQAAHEAIVLAFGHIAAGPQFSFSAELRVGPFATDYNPIAKELIAAVNQGLKAKDWTSLMNHLGVPASTHLTREDVRKAVSALDFRRDDKYRFMVRTEFDLSKSIGYQRFDRGLGWAPGPDAHPDGGVWVFAWSPLMREAFYCLHDGSKTLAFRRNLQDSFAAC